MSYILQADLGLTAIPSTQILDIMSNDFYEKYEEYRNVVSERKDRTMRQTNYSIAKIESHQVSKVIAFISVEGGCNNFCSFRWLTLSKMRWSLWPTGISR